MIRLADGVVTGRDQRCWAPGPRRAVDAAGSGHSVHAAGSGDPVDASDAELPPGAAVAVGPADADEASVGTAITALGRLVEAGGVVAAGAGVDLGAGFWSARLEGAGGDRRDAVLAALRVLGPDSAARLGDRAAVLVALFGPAATKRVGSSAGVALEDGRWSALTLASAASDVLGPEQLEQVLALHAPAGIDPLPHGVPSILAGQLGQVLAPVAQPRRLDIVRDLWDRVCDEQEVIARRVRLRASQARVERVEELTARVERFEDDLLVAAVQAACGPDPSIAQAARWVPGYNYWFNRFDRIVQDALAATVLLRTAIAFTDHGPDGIEQHRDEIEAAAKALSGSASGVAARRVAGLIGIPARPGTYARELHSRLLSAKTIDAKVIAFATQRFAHARDYATVVLRAFPDLVSECGYSENTTAMAALRAWARQDLRPWRAAAGYTAERVPAGWEHPVWWIEPGQPPVPSLADRLRDRPETAPAETETIGDLLWYAELADALAQLHGHEQAVESYFGEMVHFDTDPPRAEISPLSPRLESIPLAVASAAQLVSFGGEVPRRHRNWAELVDGLLAATTLSEALVGVFDPPATLVARDGDAIPGIGARFELAREPRMLAEWSQYMGNCIAGAHYIEEAAKGRCALVALRAEDGRILANVDVRHAGQRWHIREMQARFNAEPDPALRHGFQQWLATVPLPISTVEEAPRRRAGGRAGRPTGQRPRNRILAEIAGPLGELAQQAMTTSAAAAEVLAVVAAHAGRGSREAATPEQALTALRRVSPAGLAAALRAAIEANDLVLADVWTASGVRPLDAALARLDPAQRVRFDQLEQLRGDQPLPRTLRILARRPEVAPARTMDLIALRLRVAIGTLIRAGDPALIRSLALRPHTPMLCALLIALNSAWPDSLRAAPVTAPREITIPGFPPSSLDGDPWRAAWPEARELGAGTDEFWNQIAAGGLLLPADWLGAGGWPALWSRAARNT